MNLHDKGKQICQKLRKEGLNGIKFAEAYVENTIEQEDYDTLYEYHNALNNQLHLIITPITTEFQDDDNPYTTTEFNTNQFKQDLKNHLQTNLGPDITINHYPGCNEYECIRTK